MGAGYGLAQQGIFRMPYALQRGLYGGGGNTDPLGALIGNALGTYQAGREKDINDQLAAKQESDRANWEDFQKGVEAYKAGLTTQAPSMLSPSDAGRLTTDTNPTPATPSSQAAQPVERFGGTPLYRDLQRPAPPGKFTFIHEPGGPVLAGNEGTGAVTDTGAKLAPPVPKQPGFHIEWGDAGDGTGRQVAKWVADAPGTAGAPPSAVTVPGISREPAAKPTPQQGEKAEFGASALAAWQQVEKERTQNPQVEAEVGKIMASPAFVQAIPGIRSSADMVKLLKTAGASDAAQRYIRAKWSFLDNIIRTRIPGGRMSGAYITQVQSEFMPSLDTAANTQIRTNELQSILSAQGESGYDLNPDVWNRAVKRHGVDKIDLQNLLAGGSGYNPKHTDYPPGFTPR